MLEHLFNLELYGEELVAKVKLEAVNCTEQLQIIGAEEKGLGDCSKEALNQAIRELKLKDEEFTSAQISFAEADRAYKAVLALQELACKRKLAQEKQVQLEQARSRWRRNKLD